MLQVTHGVACAPFACCVMGHRTAWKTFPPQKGSSNQEELYQEVAQPSSAQMLACHTPMTLHLCLLLLPTGPSSPRGDGGASWLQPQDLPRGCVGCELTCAQQQEGRGWALDKLNSKDFGMAGRRRQEDSSAQSCHYSEDRSPCGLLPALLSHDIAPPTGLPEAYIILLLPRCISCSFFAVVQLLTDI